VRHVPELTFAIDRSKKMTGRMEELLGRVRKRERRAAEAAAAANDTQPTESRG
jgi:ribosome-binding factor A